MIVSTLGTQWAILTETRRFIGLEGRTDARIPTIIWYNDAGVPKAWGVNEPPDDLLDEDEIDQNLRKTEWLSRILSLSSHRAER